MKSVVEGEKESSNEKILNSRSANHRRREGVREKDEHFALDTICETILYMIEIQTISIHNKIKNDLKKVIIL